MAGACILPHAAAAAAVLVALMAMPAGALASASPNCASGGVTLEATAQVRVYSTGRGKLDKVYACGLRTGTATPLGDYRSCAGVGRVEKIAIVGKRVAVSGFACREEAVLAWVAVYDATTGKGTRRTAVPPPADKTDVDEAVTALALGRDGSVAWIAQIDRDSTMSRLVAKAGTDRRTAILDRGSRITCTLTLLDSTLTWTNRNVMRSARL